MISPGTVTLVGTVTGGLSGLNFYPHHNPASINILEFLMPLLWKHRILLCMSIRTGGIPANNRGGAPAKALGSFGDCRYYIPPYVHGLVANNLTVILMH